MSLFEDMGKHTSVRQGDSCTDKVLYLTFDDGPGKNTARILETLEKYNAKASFFFIGRKGFAHVTDILAAGHTLGMHGYTHDKNVCYGDDQIFLRELAQFRQELAEHTDYVPRVIRFPFGSINRINKEDPDVMKRLCKGVEQAGYRYFDFDVVARDTFDNKTPEAVFNAVISGILAADQKHTMIVLHEPLDHSADAVERILIWGILNGYTFLPITDDTPDCVLDAEKKKRIFGK